MGSRAEKGRKDRKVMTIRIPDTQTDRRKHKYERGRKILVERDGNTNRKIYTTSFNSNKMMGVCLFKKQAQPLLSREKAQYLICYQNQNYIVYYSIKEEHETHDKKKVIDHYESPKNVGSFDKADKAVGTGLVGAPACGDVMKLQIKVGEDGKIEDAVFKASTRRGRTVCINTLVQTFGCGSAIASSSVATEWVKGMHIDEASKIKNTEIAKHLSLPPVKLHCSMLAEDAIKAAIKDYKNKTQAKAGVNEAQGAVVEEAQKQAASSSMMLSLLCVGLRASVCKLVILNCRLFWPRLVWFPRVTGENPTRAEAMLASMLSCRRAKHTSSPAFNSLQQAGSKDTHTLNVHRHLVRLPPPVSLRRIRSFLRKERGRPEERRRGSRGDERTRLRGGRREDLRS
eukprot:767806-Hanusia_phi.AAC.1